MHTGTGQERGFVAIETAIIALAVLVIAVVSTVTMLSLSFGLTGAGKTVAEDGVSRLGGSLALQPGVLAFRGDVDVDGNGAIDLGGLDEQAVTRISFLVKLAGQESIDLTPPYVADDTGTDPDASGLDPSAVISFVSRDFQAAPVAWTVSFPGTDDGDYVLDPGEQAEVSVWLLPLDTANALYTLGTGPADPYMDTTGQLLQERGSFEIEISPFGASPVTIERVLPVEIGTSTLAD